VTELAELATTFPDLSAALPGVAHAAATDATILILGESGTGRTRLARAVHAASRRATRPLVEVDPAATPVGLFEGELFGWRRGAFSGAENHHDGKVARAGDGTLLFDPVEALPLEVQPKLLRLLSERTWAPLGGREQPADLRFLAVASADLADRVAAGAFRADLFWRLDVVTYTVPPLRNRPHDLPELVERLGRDLCARFGRSWPGIAPAAAEWMRRHAWPGNLRELRNVLERAVILHRGEAPLDPPAPAGATKWPAPRRLDEVERAEIVIALAHTAGHQGRAAELLGISRKALWEKRRRFGVP
jgi:DNA-binding NtrC family response regulator